MDNEQYLTKKEAAAFLKVTERTVDRYAAKGILGVYRIPSLANGIVRFKRSDIESLLETK